VALVVAILLALLVVPAPWGVPLVVAGIVVEVGESFVLWRWSRRRRAQVGAEAMLGAEAEVVDERFVRVAGELWQARDLVGRRPGDVVRIRRIDGLTLEVE
jgi:membrane protein implicated in regulation of membrane protease activity